jgi:hypothetical protein
MPSRFQEANRNTFRAVGRLARDHEQTPWNILQFGIFKPLFTFLRDSCHPSYKVLCDLQLHFPNLGSKPIKNIHKGLSDRKIVILEFPEEDIPTMSLQIVYGIIMGQKGLTTIWFDSNHRGHGHCEVDIVDIRGGRLWLPINE